LCVGDVEQDGEYHTTPPYSDVSPSFRSRALKSLSQRTSRDQRYAMDVEGFDSVNDCQEQASFLLSAVSAPPQTQFPKNCEEQHQSGSSQGADTHNKKPVYDTHNNVNAHAPTIKMKRRECSPCRSRPVALLSSLSSTPSQPAHERHLTNLISMLSRSQTSGIPKQWTTMHTLLQARLHVKLRMRIGVHVCLLEESQGQDVCPCYSVA
jgi:hypothetical protein